MLFWDPIALRDGDAYHTARTTCTGLAFSFSVPLKNVLFSQRRLEACITKNLMKMPACQIYLMGYPQFAKT
jgi:hypothetical protein